MKGSTDAASARRPPTDEGGKAAESGKAGRTGQAGDRRDHRRQRRRRGLLARILSFCSLVLTLLTALAVTALLARATAPAAEDAARLEALAPAAGPAAPKAAAWPDLSAMMTALGQVTALGELRLLDSRVGLRLRDGSTLPLDLDRVALTRVTKGWRVQTRLAAEELGALFEPIAAGAVRWTGGPVDLALDVPDGGGPLRLHLASTAAGTIRLAAMPAALPFERLEAALQVDADSGEVVLDRLRLASPVFDLEAQGRFAPSNGERPIVRGSLRLENVDAPAAWELWPSDVARGARVWVTENITEGTIEVLEVDLDLAPDRFLADGLADRAITGHARIRGAVVHYRRPMAPVTDAAAEVRFGVRGMTFELTGGRIDDVAVENGTLTIRDYHLKSLRPRLELDVRANGPVRTMLAVTAAPPVELAAKRGLTAEGSAGRGAIRVEVALPLLRDLPLEQVDFRFSGAFEDVRLPDAAAGRDLSEANVKLVATFDRVELEGRGRLDGVPLELGFVADSEQGVQRLTASGTVDATLLDRLGLPAGLPISGPVGLRATVDLPAGADAAAGERTDLRLDVTASTIDLAPLGASKPAGVDGQITASIRDDAGGTNVRDLALAWPGTDIRGSLALDRQGGLRRLNLDRLVAGDTDADVAVERSDGHYVVRLTGRSLDLRPWRSSRAATDGSAALVEPGLDLDLDITAERLWLASTGSLHAVTVRARIASGKLVEAYARGQVGAEHSFVRVDVGRPSPAGAQVLQWEAQDTGELLRALGIDAALTGGTLAVDGLITRQRPTLAVEGTLQLDDYVLVRAPAAIRLLSQAPVDLDVPPDAVAVSRTTASFALADDVLTLADASLLGSELAVTLDGSLDLATDELNFAGSLAPVATLNRLVANLPLIGRLLRGENGAGAFVVTFAVAGPRDDPSVTVNPLSIITPGIVRDLFSGVEITPSEEVFSDRPTN